MLEMPKPVRPTVSQRVAIAKALIPRARAEARKRQRLAKRAQFSACAMDLVSAHIGWSRATLVKAIAVLDAAKRDRAFRDLVADMDRTGRIDRSYRALRLRQGISPMPRKRKAPDRVGDLIERLGALSLAKAELEVVDLRIRVAALDGLIESAHRCFVEPPRTCRFLNILPAGEVAKAVAAAVENYQELK